MSCGRTSYYRRFGGTREYNLYWILLTWTWTGFQPSCTNANVTEAALWVWQILLLLLQENYGTRRVQNLRFQPAAGGLFFTAAIRSNPLLRFTRAWVGETFSIWPFKNYITIMITLIEMNTYLIIVDILERPSTTGGFWTGGILCPWVLKETITFPPIFLKHKTHHHWSIATFFYNQPVQTWQAMLGT